VPSLSLFWLILVLTFGLLPPKAAAQKLRGNAVYLKNGSVVTGRIIQNDSIEGLKIANDCGIWFFEPNEFDSIGHFAGGNRFTAKNTGYVNLSYGGLLFGFETTPSPSVNMVHAWKFGQNFSAGAGLGYEYFDWDVVPVFSDFRYSFYSERFSPFVFGQAGYSFTLDRDQQTWWGTETKRAAGGPMLSFGAGFRAGVASKSAFIFSFAWRFQKLSYESTDIWNPGTKREIVNHYNRIAITVGFLFE
jgi:hypothetical protein